MKRVAYFIVSTISCVAVIFVLQYFLVKTIETINPQFFVKSGSASNFIVLVNIIVFPILVSYLVYITKKKIIFHFILSTILESFVLLAFLLYSSIYKDHLGIQCDSTGLMYELPYVFPSLVLYSSGIVLTVYFIQKKFLKPKGISRIAVNR